MDKKIFLIRPCYHRNKCLLFKMYKTLMERNTKRMLSFLSKYRRYDKSRAEK